MKTPINTDPFIFRWKVNEAGYQWVNGIMDGKPHLVRRLDPGKGAMEIEPAKEAFAEFAKLDSTQDEIKEFADKHGDLFDSYSEPDHVAHDGTVSGGASLKRWQSEIGDMRVLFELWENIGNRRFAELRKIIRWLKTKDDHRSVNYLIETPRRRRDQMLAHTRISKGLLSRFAGDNGLLFAARCALMQEINLRLIEHSTVPALSWTPDYHERLVFKPPHFLAAMWLQFAQALTGEFGIKRCLACGRFVQIGPGGRRADFKTCGAACRKRKSRNQE